VYSDILIEKESSKFKAFKVAIIQKISGMFGSLFGPTIAKATKEIRRVVKIQLVFDLVIVVGIATLILMVLKVLKNQKVQHESLVLTEAINFNSIAGTVTKIIATTTGFIFLAAGLLYVTAFLTGYFKGNDNSTIIGFTSIINSLKKLAENALSKEGEGNTENKRANQLRDISKKLDELAKIYGNVIDVAATKKKEYEKANKDSNAFVKFFNTFIATTKAVGWKGGFDIIATPIVLVATPLKIELPIAFEKLKSLITKNEGEENGEGKEGESGNISLDYVYIEGEDPSDLRDHLIFKKGRERVTDEAEKERILAGYGRVFPKSSTVSTDENFYIRKIDRGLSITISVKNTDGKSLHIVYVYHIDNLDMLGIDSILKTVKKFADKSGRKIINESKTLKTLKNELIKLYNVK
jgi:hypothetical protein